MKSLSPLKMSVIFLLVVLGVATSCGSKDKDGEGGNATARNDHNTNLSLEGTSNSSASTINQMIELIRNGAFSKSSFTYSTQVYYPLVDQICTTNGSWFQFTSCGNSTVTQITENSNGSITGHYLGSSKQEIINEMLASIAESTNKYLVDSYGNPIYNGIQATGMVVEVNNNSGNNYSILIDLQKPIASNPVRKVETHYSGDSSVMSIGF